MVSPLRNVLTPGVVLQLDLIIEFVLSHDLKIKKWLHLLLCLWSVQVKSHDRTKFRT